MWLRLSLLFFILAVTAWCRPQLETVQYKAPSSSEDKLRPKYTLGMGACPDSACSNPPCSPMDCDQNAIVYQLVRRAAKPEDAPADDTNGDDDESPKEDEEDYSKLKNPQIRIKQPKIDVKPPKFTITEPKVEVDPGKISVKEKAKFSVTQPELNVDQPVVSLKQPRFRIEQQPIIQIVQPKLVLEQPHLTVAQPRLRVKAPQIALSDPGFEVVQPKFRITQPKVLVEQAEIRVTQPEITLNERILKALQSKPEGQRLVRRVPVRYVRRLVTNPDGTQSIQLVKQVLPPQPATRQANGDLVSEAVVVDAGNEQPAAPAQTYQQPRVIYTYPQQQPSYQVGQPLQYQTPDQGYQAVYQQPVQYQVAQVAQEQPAAQTYYAAQPVQYQVAADGSAPAYQVAYQQPAQTYQQPVQYSYPAQQAQYGQPANNDYDVVRLPVYESRPENYAGDYYDQTRGQVVYADGRTQAARAFSHPPVSHTAVQV